jgi:arginyl-tRNA--protein-N-Asp/Glu arginylyltransferase
MRLLFSEYKSDYPHYIFPYAIWAIPEEGDSPAKMFASGFLPSTAQLDRYYLCRHVRIKLAEFSFSSENRRIRKKGEHFQSRLVEKKELGWNDWWRTFCKNYADNKFGKDVMPVSRLDHLIQSKIVSHFLLISEKTSGKNIGLVFLLLDPPDFAFYYYSFYDLDYFRQNLGMYMMLCAVDEMKRRNFAYIYLGSCYNKNALYKTQFSGAEFFNGFRWSNNLSELKYLIERDSAQVDKHLLENGFFLEEFYHTPIERLKDLAHFQISKMS